MPDIQINFDLSDDNQFRMYVVQQFTHLNEKVSVLDELKSKVEKHEDIYQSGKILGLPILAAISATCTYFLKKLGL